jgi:negative regulator of sigma E activity
MMNATSERFTVMNEFADAPARAHETRASGGPAVWLAVLGVITVALLVWFVLSTGVPHVSAAAGDESATPQVPYFPSQYVNQASEPSPVPATF